MRRHKFFLCLAVFFLFLHWSAQAKLLVITHSYNRPDFIEIQDKTFKKFLKDEYEFVVFNDGPTDEAALLIEQMCNKLHIRSVRIPQNIHSRPYLYREKNESYQFSAVRCANVVQYSLDVLGFDHEENVMIIDSDMFLVKEFSPKEYMKEFDIAGVWQKREGKHGPIEYIWNGLLFFNMKTIPDRKTLNFNCGTIDGTFVDVGGYIHYYLKTYPNTKIRYIDVRNTDDLTGSEEEVKADPKIHRFLANKRKYNVEFLADFSFFHYRSGGNWDRRSAEYHHAKTKLFHEFIAEILKDA